MGLANLFTLSFFIGLESDFSEEMADRHGEADKESTLEPTNMWSPQVEIAEISSDEESNRRELAADRAERENRSAGNGRAELVAPRESQDDRNVRAVLLPMIRKLLGQLNEIFSILLHFQAGTLQITGYN